MELLREQLNSQVSVAEKRAGISQLFLPAWREDGDMIGIYLEQTANGGEELIRISDRGGTLLHVFDVDLDTLEGRELLKRTVARSMISENNGNLFLDVKPEDLLDGVLRFIQAITRVDGMGEAGGESEG